MILHAYIPLFLIYKRANLTYRSPLLEYHSNRISRKTHHFVSIGCLFIYVIMQFHKNSPRRIQKHFKISPKKFFSYFFEIRVFLRPFLLAAHQRFYQQHLCKWLTAAACTRCVLLATYSKFPTFATTSTSKLATCKLDGVQHILWFDY